MTSLPILAAKHTGLRVDYTGLLGGTRRVLHRDPGRAEMLRQLEEHLAELGRRWYAGDTAVVDEILQLYCIEPEAREALEQSSEIAPESQLDAKAAKEFDQADWYWRTRDPDDSADHPGEAIHKGMVGLFTVCEIASSFHGPTRFGFNAPVLDPESDDEEFLHFATIDEAIAAAQERRTATAAKREASE